MACKKIRTAGILGIILGCISVALGLYVVTTAISLLSLVNPSDTQRAQEYVIGLSDEYLLTGLLIITGSALYLGFGVIGLTLHNKPHKWKVVHTTGIIFIIVVFINMIIDFLAGAFSPMQIIGIVIAIVLGKTYISGGKALSKVSGGIEI